MKRVIFENDEGGVSVLIPSPNCKLSIEQIAQKDVPLGTAFDIVESNEIPSDRYFRNAWRKNGKKIETDMDKARDIQMAVIKAKRKVKLEELDIETLKGKDVQVKKQVLRDLPETYDLSVATTPEELKVMIPKELSSI